ncbi:immunoglobulin domain-containing protein [Cytophagales bacterium LB-30]|uniref:Immunoglobulin domain-containing protein n=1 Tax=Shiella aurantiaca TaxID=3058365 RepID=A0ABT8F418_9BACT|nr:T9SS type A sorting domain-containing protein [Shiella aurantiaca]MDN4165207.1 immunoglobulin domain-containing protein [Shiella aurantiaca]
MKNQFLFLEPFLRGKSKWKVLMLSLALMFCTSSLLLAQSYFTEFATGIQGSNDKYTNNAFVDSLGNLWVVGGFAGSADFNPDPAVAYLLQTNLNTTLRTDPYIARYGTNGEFLSAVNPFMSNSAFNDRAYDVAGTKSGYVYYSTGSEVGRGTLGKYDLAGALQWEILLLKGGPGTQQHITYPYALDTDEEDNLYVTGAYQGTMQFIQTPTITSRTSNNLLSGWWGKYSADGQTLEWLHTFTDTNAIGYDIEVDTLNDRVLVLGTLVGTVDFDFSEGSALVAAHPSARSLFLAEYSTVDGSFIRVNALGNVTASNFETIGARLAVDANGDVYVAGHLMNGAVDFDLGASAAMYTPIGSWDAFLVKYSLSGNEYQFEWLKSISGSSNNEFTRDLDILANGNILWSTSAASMSIIVGGGANLSALGSSDIVLMEYNPADGTVVNQLRLGGNEEDYAFTAPSASGFAVVGTTATNSIDFQGENGTLTFTAPNSGGYHIFFNQFVPCEAPAMVSQTTGPIEICEGTALLLESEVTGSGLNYQWRKDGQDIDGATSASYEIASTSFTDAATYSLAVTGLCGTITSTDISVTINDSPNPYVVQYRDSLYAVFSANAAFTEAEANSAGKAYVWYKDDVDLGLASTSYKIFATEPGDYRVEVTENNCTGASTAYRVGRTFYVNRLSAVTNGDGSSWESPFLSLHDALSVAVSGDQVWVAQGTYRPSTSDRLVRFTVPSGVKVFGGFAGTETDPSERALGQYTILNGDINGDDDGLVNLSNTTMVDNSLTLMYLENPKGNVVDGFIFQRGFANYTNSDVNGQQAAGLFVYAIDEQDNSVTVRNVMFRDNAAVFGASFLVRNDVGASNLSSTFENCIFLRNSAEIAAGGSAVNFGTNTNTRNVLTMVNCYFENNNSTNFRNAGWGMGTIMGTNTTNGGTVEVEFVNSTFINNSAIQTTGTLFRLYTNNSNPNRYTFRNSVIQQAGAQTEILFRNDGGAHNLGFYATDMWGNVPTPQSANFTYFASDIYNHTQTFESTTFGGEELKTPTNCSRSMDEGTLTDVANKLPNTDLLGNPRQAGTIDRGAIEVLGSKLFPLQSVAIVGGGTFCQSDSVALEVNISGDFTAIEWKKYGSNEVFGTDTLLILNPALAEQSATYYATVSNQCNTLSTGGATVTINPTTEILSITPSTAVCENSALDLNVEAQGANLEYQWFFNGSAIDGATSTKYSIAQVDANTSGDYSVRLIGTCGTLISEAISVGTTSTTEISQQPQPVSACFNEEVSLSILANGATGYQWFRNNIEVAGATESTLTLNVSEATTGNYYCIVTGCTENVTSETVAVGALDPLVINSVSEGQEACLGSEINLSVNASGTNLSYQWLKDGVLIDNATSASLVIASFSSSDAGSYMVEVSSDCGSTSSTAIVLSEAAALSITNTYGAAAYCEGANFTLGVSATGAITYQWYKDDVAIENATQAEYVVTSALNADEGVYRCELTGCEGTLSTDNMVVNVYQTPSVSSTTGDGLYCLGASVTLSTEATGDALNYQWYFNGLAIGNATTASYSFSLSTETEGSYYCYVYNTCTGAYSASQAVFAIDAPYFTGESAPYMYCEGQTLEIGAYPNVEADTYQWYFENTPIEGATGQVLVIENLSPDNTGNYSCEASNCSGTGVYYQYVEVMANQIPTVIESSGVLSSSLQADGYQWYQNGQAIPNANGQNYSPSETGDYSVQLYFERGCGGTSEPYTFNVLGISDELSRETVVYPNPAQGVLFIKEAAGAEIQAVELMEASGKVVRRFRAKPSQIDVQDLTKGVYLLKITYLNGRVVKRVVIE